MATVTEEAAPAVVGEAPAPEPEKVAEVKEGEAKVEEVPKPEEGEQGKEADEGELEKKARKLRSRKPKFARPHHPPYFEMIKEAILALDGNGKSGSSPYAMAKYMGEKYCDELPANYRKVLAVQLRSFAAKGRLVKVKASFKLAAAEEEKAAPAAVKKATARRKRTPVPTKKRAVAASAPKEARKVRTKRARKAAPAPAPTQPKPKQPKSIRTAVSKKANKARA